MANLAAVKAQVVKKQETKKDIPTLIRKSVEELGKAVPSCMNAERLCRIALTTVRLNPKLANCTPESFLGALFQAAQLGLEPNVEGQAYLIPYSNTKDINGKKTKINEVQFQIGYKGYIELFYRHGAAQIIDMHTVYENDIFEYAYGTQQFLKHCPTLKDRGEPIAYYAVAMLRNGGSVFKVMSKDECIEHGKTHSKCYKTMEWSDEQHKYVAIDNPHFVAGTPWATDLNAMCKKTVLIQLAKLLPKSVELQKALSMDSTTKSIVKSDMFEVQDETNWNEECLKSALLPQAENSSGE